MIRDRAIWNQALSAAHEYVRNADDDYSHSSIADEMWSDLSRKMPDHLCPTGEPHDWSEWQRRWLVTRSCEMRSCVRCGQIGERQP